MYKLIHPHVTFFVHLVFRRARDRHTRCHPTVWESWAFNAFRSERVRCHLQVVQRHAPRVCDDKTARNDFAWVGVAVSVAVRPLARWNSDACPSMPRGHSSRWHCQRNLFELSHVVACPKPSGSSRSLPFSDFLSSTRNPRQK